MVGTVDKSASFNGDILGWDVSGVTSMYYMFLNAHSFNGDVSGWDVSSVIMMSQMFYDAQSFNVDISGWDVSSVIMMSQMFRRSSSFNQELCWDVGSIDTTNMFEGAGGGKIGCPPPTAPPTTTSLMPQSTRKAVDGRCGQLFGGQVCNCNGGKIYCNMDNGWCGDSDAHKHAQRGDEYDCPWPSPYPLIGDAPVDPNTWEIVVGKGTYYSPSKGETF